MSPSAPSDATPPSPPSRTAPSIALVGLLMIGAAFLLANPAFGTLDGSAWPWQVLLQTEHALVVRVLLGMWLVTGLAAFLLGLTSAQGTRSTITLGLGAALLAACSTRLTAFEIRAWSLPEMLVLIGLGAGLIVARREGTQTLGRLLAGISALVLAWLLASPLTGPIHGLASATDHAEALRAFFQDGSADFARPDPFWLTLLPQALIVLSGAVGALGLLGISWRPLLALAFFALLGALLVPLVVGVLARREGGGLHALASELVDAFLTRGFLMWLLGVFAIYDALRGRMREA